ncbi:NAD-dependent protein deacylase [Helicovermis profundi]|uniref:NAD-dependent protein deacetylase n=2 Tax=Helicovermis profundi TaxID=3065157 RepID=A0AAU9EC73_9FIRM|nr:NAD-dependent protein deacylase [Clostridia bacterium S502]
MNIEKISKFKEIIDKSQYIVFFGGAGTSTESNIPDFRSSCGLYSKKSKYGVSPEEILSIDFFNNKTERFYEYLRENLIYPDALPNSTHFALKNLEEKGKLKAIITQNIDGLHQMAGSKNVIEIHGSLYNSYCQSCGEKFNLEYVLKYEGVPLCTKCRGKIRPDVVMYGEPLSNELFDNAVNHVVNADLLIVGGSSLLVYPAAGLIRKFKGENIVIINKTPTKYDSKATIVFDDNIGKVLGEVMKYLE